MILYDFVVQQKTANKKFASQLWGDHPFDEIVCVLTVFCVGWVESWWEAKSVEIGESHEDDSNNMSSNHHIFNLKVKQLNNSSNRLKAVLKGFTTVKFLWLSVHRLLLRRCLAHSVAHLTKIVTDCHEARFGRIRERRSNGKCPFFCWPDLIVPEFWNDQNCGVFVWRWTKKDGAVWDWVEISLMVPFGWKCGHQGRNGCPSLRIQRSPRWRQGGSSRRWYLAQRVSW